MKRTALATWQTNTPTPEWNAAQEYLQAHILQRGEWGIFQQALGHIVFYAYGEGWSWLAILEKRRLGSRLYCPYGPTVTSAKALREALAALRACGTANAVTYLRVEPQGPLHERDLSRLGLLSAHRAIQPRYTWVKDLQASEEELLAEMSATNRNLYRTAGKKGLTFRVSTDPHETPLFIDMMHEVAGHNGITIHPDQYYKLMTKTLMPLDALKLYVAEHKGKPVATALVLDSPTTRYYAHAASFFAARKLHPGTPLVAQMIFDAKRDGKTAFDFYGIAPPDEPNHRWAGFTQFKQSFGGHIMHRHGTWELPCRSGAYGLYRAATHLANVLRKH